MKSLTNSKYYPWVVVALLGGVALLNYMDRQMLSTMKDSMSSTSCFSMILSAEQALQVPYGLSDHV